MLLLQRTGAVVHRTVGPVDGLVVPPLTARDTDRGGAQGRGRPAPPPLTWWLVAGLLALVLLPLNVAVSNADFDVPPLVMIGAATAQSAALVLIRVRPGAATALQLLAVTVLAFAIQPGNGPTWPLTGSGMLTLVAHVGLVATRSSQGEALTIWWAQVLGLSLVVQVGGSGRKITDWLAIMIVYLFLSAVVLGVVLATRRWRTIRRELADARRDVEEEQRQRVVAEERTRIARELHDVVAHSMSVVHMQATSATYRLKDLDAATQVEFAQIATGARSAMREMRQLLAVLRDQSASAELAPVPDLGRLPELVGSAGRAGVPVEVRQTEAVTTVTLPEEVTLSAYRIVQESLSNVIRHAPGARTTVDLDLDGQDLLLTIENGTAEQAASPMETPGRPGLGLTGMRERARLVGGSVETGARDGGGYRVVARLPIRGAE